MGVNMTGSIRLIDEHPLARHRDGRLKSRIGTVFPRSHTVVTVPGIHAMQRLAYVDVLNAERTASGGPPLTRQEESALWANAVDLIMEGDTIQIRPDPNNMPLAFEADRLLRRLVSKYQILFLNIFNPKVREAVKQRGECWRFASLPTSRSEMKRRISELRIAIQCGDIYYYNSTTGTHFLTYQEFSQLGRLGAGELRRHLQEIQKYSASTNRLGNAEIAFFMSDGTFSHKTVAGYDFAEVDESQLLSLLEMLTERFREAVPAEFHSDNPKHAGWRNRMFSSLVAEKSDLVPEEMLLGLSPEFFMEVQWLPGGRVVRGDLRFDVVFEDGDESKTPASTTRRDLRDEAARELLHNFVREYDDLEYVNIGRVENSLSRRRPLQLGRRAVYLAVIKVRSNPKEIVNVVRFQKWGVREHLDRGKQLLQAIYDSQEYTEYVLDRRLACRHLGMNIPWKITAGKLCEKHVGQAPGSKPIMVWSPYFERAYVRGVATDKVPHQRLADEAFWRQFARLLGAAAAPNLIVGRCTSANQTVLFDDGDEVLVEPGGNAPAQIVVADQMGTFVDFSQDLSVSAPSYAEPINRRVEFLPDPSEFALIYLDAFLENFLAIQQKCRMRRRAFDSLFHNRPYDEKGSFAFRWEQVLKRLDRSDPGELRDRIRDHLRLPVTS
jgi:hypothetical protein